MSLPFLKNEPFRAVNSAPSKLLKTNGLDRQKGCVHKRWQATKLVRHGYAAPLSATLGKVVTHTGLAVVESRWWASGNNSVRPLFETLAGIVEGNPHSVRYDMFVEEASLAAIIADIAEKPELHSIYIGAHGDGNSIGGLGTAAISRVRLRNMLHSANAAGSVVGLYFGSCLIATRQNASFFLTQAQTTGLQWIAGYTESVDWVGIHLRWI